METPVPVTPPPQPHPAAPQKPAPKKERNWGTLGFVASLGLALAFIFFIVNPFIMQTYEVFGQSMESTLHEGDYLIISKVGPTIAKIKKTDYLPKRGDIVVLDSSLTGNRLIKRVIGLPGERVVVDGGQVTVYPEGSETGFDPYQQLGLPAKYTSGSLSVTVPEGHVFVIGDNREDGGSLDSRNELGPIPEDKIIGKLWLRLWPFSQPKHN